MQTLRDLVAAVRDRDGPAFLAPDRAADYGAAAFATTAWKVGNLLRHYGVRPGARVAVAVGPKHPEADDEPGHLGPDPTPILAMLGAAVDGAVVDPDPPGAVDATALVAPDDWWDRYETGPGTNRIAYGGPPEEPAVAHLEGEAWSENPLAPPGEVGPGDAVLAADRTYDHGEVVAAARRVVDEYGLTGDDRVAIRAPLTEPGALVAGVLAPLSAGAPVVLGDAAGATAPDSTVVVTAPDADPRSAHASRSARVLSSEDVL